MHVTGKGERWKKIKRHKFGSTQHRWMQKSAHLATGTTIPFISVYQPFFHQDNTNHLQLSNMFTQSLSHMFPWPMCQKTEQLPIKVLLKSSECEPNCLTRCDTIATQSPHHCLTLKVLRRVSQRSASTPGPSNVGDAGIQTNVNNLVWTTEDSGRDIGKRPLLQKRRLKVRQRNSSLRWPNWYVLLLLHTNTWASRFASANTCMHKWMTFQHQTLLDGVFSLLGTLSSLK